MNIETVIKYVKGDATDPAGPGPRIIAHICNDAGGWGRGFVLALSRRWPNIKVAYKFWHGGLHKESLPPFELGWIQMVQVVEGEIYVANMIAQHGTKTSPEGIPPIRYEALDQCLATLSEEARAFGATVHMPRIGCGLAGGRWEEVEPIIVSRLIDVGVPVIVYDYEGDGPERIAWRE